MCVGIKGAWFDSDDLCTHTHTRVISHMKHIHIQSFAILHAVFPTHNLKLPIKLWTRAHTIEYTYTYTVRTALHQVHTSDKHYIQPENTLHYYLVSTKWHRRYTTKTLWHRKVLVRCCSALNYFILSHAAPHITDTHTHRNTRSHILWKAKNQLAPKLNILKNLFEYTIESILNPDVMLTI